MGSRQVNGAKPNRLTGGWRLGGEGSIRPGWVYESPVPPHPSPLPQGEGESLPGFRTIRCCEFTRAQANGLPAHEPRKHPTSNIERPTSKDGAATASWMLDVGCWLLGVLILRFRGPRREKLLSGNSLPKGEGRGEGGVIVLTHQGFDFVRRAPHVRGFQR